MQTFNKIQICFIGKLNFCSTLFDCKCFVEVAFAYLPCNSLYNNFIFILILFLSSWPILIEEKYYFYIYLYRSAVFVN